MVPGGAEGACMKPATRKNILAVLERYRVTEQFLRQGNRDLNQANVRLCQESGRQMQRIDELERKLRRLMTARVEYDSMEDHYTCAYRINRRVLQTARDPNVVWDMVMEELKKSFLSHPR
jgi:hypothetical protein